MTEPASRGRDDVAGTPASAATGPASAATGPASAATGPASAATGPASAATAAGPATLAAARGAWLVFALALAARLAVVGWAAGRIPPTADGGFYHTIATRIAGGLGYTWLWPDGAVTYAGHYPVGYPALVGATYWLAGPHPPAAMWLNAVLGALAAAAAYSLAGRAGGPRAAAIAGGLVALHPGLLAYTPAMMTEGVTAALVVAAAWAAMGGGGRHGDAVGARPVEKTPFAPPERTLDGASGSARRGWRRAVIAGVVVGVATLVRPQSLVLAPIFGWLAARGIAGATARRAAVRRLVTAGLATIAALAVCAPWTARNCVRMKTCALVSYNGGWNLLIGADDAATGAWAEIKVPAECREVFDEAQKDVCFGGAARRYIAEHPGRWLALAPKKLAATFDYAGAGGWYLHAANPAAFPDRAKTAVGGIETVFERAMLILALLAAASGSARTMRARRSWRSWRSWRAGTVLAVVAAGLLGAVSLHAWIGYVALGIALLVSGRSLRPPGPRGEDAPQGAESAARHVGAAGGGVAEAQESAVVRHVGAAGGGAAEAQESAVVRHVGAAGGGPEEGAVLPAATAAVLLSLAATHAVFFGAGRYSLVAFPFVTAVAALAIARVGARPAANGARNAAAGAGGAE